MVKYFTGTIWHAKQGQIFRRSPLPPKEGQIFCHGPSACKNGQKFQRGPLDPKKKSNISPGLQKRINKFVALHAIKKGQQFHHGPLGCEKMSQIGLRTLSHKKGKKIAVLLWTAKKCQHFCHSPKDHKNLLHFRNSCDRGNLFLILHVFLFFALGRFKESF